MVQVPSSLVPVFDATVAAKAPMSHSANLKHSNSIFVIKSDKLCLPSMNFHYLVKIVYLNIQRVGGPHDY